MSSSDLCNAICGRVAGWLERVKSLMVFDKVGTGDHDGCCTRVSLSWLPRRRYNRRRCSCDINVDDEIQDGVESHCVWGSAAWTSHFRIFMCFVVE